MKLKILYLLAGFLSMMPLVSVACSGENTTEPGLTDEQLASLKQELSETGGCNVETLAAAEAVAGFPIATPDYLPDGFYRQTNIIITKLGGGLPEGTKPEYSPIIVNTFYYLQGDDTIMFNLQQIQGKMGLGGSEAVELCGLQGERKYSEADSQRKYPSTILTLACEKDGTTYTIYATLAGPLDEAMIEQVFCSLIEN